MDLFPVSLVLQDNRDSRRVTWPSFCLELSLAGLTSSGRSPKPHPSLVSLLAEMGLNKDAVRILLPLSHVGVAIYLVHL